MYDELVKALRETDFGDTCVLCEHEDMCKSNDCITIQAADAIEALSKLALDEHNRAAKLAWERRWIPVTERLPEAGERVLCYCRANIYEVMKMRTDGAWVHNDKVYDSAYMSGFVTHWMPLPEPPKEET